MSFSPYFSYLQGGDYHVFPDGRVLISGNHQLWDSIRGFVGRHQLIWFSNTGYLDTTRTHRTGGSCAVYRFKELPPGSSPGQTGQFICSGTCNQFDGQQVDKIFRVHADGSVDTTFRTGVYIGEARDYLPLNDGRVYAGGNFRRTVAPQDTLRLVRFLPDGELDPAFTIPQFTAGEGLTTPFGAYVYTINPWRNGKLIITGHFRRVNGQVRKGICMIDTTGQLLPDFADAGVGPFTYTGLTAASIHRIVFNSDTSQAYICGAYSGYNDGLNNYPEQAFITRLNVQELGSGVAEQSEEHSAFSAHPNPATDQVVLRYAFGAQSGAAQALLRDASGRVVEAIALNGKQGQHAWGTERLAPGLYLVQFLNSSQVLHTQRLVIQR
ncbi:MAG: T9SS type A sorting domain-containing protein [Flavobacteriales bacterium]